MTTRAQATRDDLQVVCFELGAERYGLDIARVFEIIRSQSITAVPSAPSFVEGVINLRGRIVPIVDLRARFGLGRTEATKASRIMVVDAGVMVGLVVDGVSEVLMVPPDAIEPTPELATGYDSAYLAGIARIDERLVILLDLARLFAGDEQAALAA